ncbi:MAG: rhomboid protease GluP [Acidobacteriota bacterium]|jgi:rhomboid protease GluP|nr:rhomboid protease GluP [Acidobacteriota bacterium]
MRSLRRTPATAALLAFIAVVFLGQQLDSEQLLLQLGADQARAVLADGQYWRLLSSMFLHGGWMHVLLNGWALFQIGALFELWLGAGRMLGTYFVTGILASLTSVLWNQYRGHFLQLSVGASGAIFGIIGALIAFLARRRGRLNPAARSILSQLLFWAGINVFLLSNLGMIDNAAHIGGLVAGLAIGLTLRDPEPVGRPEPMPVPAPPPGPGLPR